MLLPLFLMGRVEAQVTLSSEITINPFSSDSSYAINPWVLSNSIQVFIINEGDEEQLMPSAEWTLDSTLGIWAIREEYRSKYETVSQIRITYEAYPFAIRRVYQNRTVRKFDSTLFIQKEDSISEQLLRSSSSFSFDDSEVQQRGSLSRGIIVGSNQDFALESGLQFELNGQLTDDISINASLTDRNIPFQPDGTTQNIREFDRVFIQLQSEQTRLEMGDVDISLEQSTFARLNRRLQGAAGYSDSKYGDYKGALSVVRGTFKSVSFEGSDGVQGPYRLTGRDNEEFVIVLAGTERVYINGQRVDRGEENDYIIDYGLGEVFFTNNLLIKDETRIVIEYEYIDQNFNRTLIAAEGQEDFFDGRLKIGASIIRQADGDELLSQQTLTESDVNLLRGVGDDLSNAIVSGERLATEDDDEFNVRYARIDTSLNGEVFSIFKNIPGSDESIYIVSFSRVEGGSYRRVSNSVNGLLYEWVGPGLGEYEPFRRLPAPEKHQIVSLVSSYQFSKHVELFGEWAASSFDQNRFSSIGDNDNNDISYLSGFKLKELDSPVGMIDASFSRRYSGGNFQFFERTREVEFDRKWNISRDIETEEDINELEVKARFSDRSSLQAEYGIINRSDFRGYRQGAVLSSDESKLLTLNYTQDWIRSDDSILGREGNWFRQIGSLGKEIREKWTPYVSFEQERKEETSSANDSLLNTSFSFAEVGPGLRYSGAKLNVDVSVITRQENRVLENKLKPQATSLEQRLKFSYQPGRAIRTNNELVVRSKEFTSDFQQQGNSNRTGLLIRSVTDYETNNQNWNGQIFYEVNTERRALFQEAYIEVGPELGQYVWVDTNEDGVQQIDEFFPELSPNEGIYIRQLLPSDELFPVADLRARLRNEFRLFSFLNGGSGVEEFFSKINIYSRIDLLENSTTSNLEDIYLLRWNTFRNDSTTLQGRVTWEKELDILPEYDFGDLSVGLIENRSLNRLSNESQKLFSSQFYLNASYRSSERTRLTLGLVKSRNETVSNQLQSRNFSIESFSVTPGIESTINRSWQTGFSVSYSVKEDQFPVNPVKARLLKVANSHRAFLFRKVQANGRVEFRNTEVDGTTSSFGAFELTEGTGEGSNLIWSMNGNYRVSDLIRLSLNYDGRTVRNRPDIHTIKLVVSAVF